MIDKIKSALNLFRVGSAVANVNAWKTGQITGRVLTGFILSLLAALRAFGYDLQITDDQAQSIAAAIFSVWLCVDGLLHITTNPNIGIPASSPAAETDNEPTITDYTVNSDRQIERVERTSTGVVVSVSEEHDELPRANKNIALGALQKKVQNDNDRFDFDEWQRQRGEGG
jgi:hypothetical protein